MIEQQPSEMATTDMIDDLSQTEKIELCDHLRISEKHKSFKRKQEIEFESPSAVARIFSQAYGNQPELYGEMA